MAKKKFGCKYHDDCFTCPFPDCRYGGEEGRDKPKTAEELAATAEYNRKRQAKYYQEHKAERAIKERERRINARLDKLGGDAEAQGATKSELMIRLGENEYREIMLELITEAQRSAAGLRNYDANVKIHKSLESMKTLLEIA